MYLIRLDDACEYMDIDKWSIIESILDKYDVKPIVAIIPKCADKMFTDVYQIDDGFWYKAKKWQEKGWTIGLHGYDHVYKDIAEEGLNPVNSFSEFSGEKYSIQLEKIKMGISIFQAHGIEPKCFVAPAHTFDELTIQAIINGSSIRIISDTIASNTYYQNGIWFVPQQCGSLRKLPCKVVTGCYHPNTMSDVDFSKLESFLGNNTVASFTDISFNKKRRISIYDKLLRWAYFRKH